MARLARTVAGGASVLRYDRRGYARSWPHPGPFGVDDHVEDLLALVGDNEVILVGHSYGGNVAIAAGARLPAGQVRGVSVYETPLSWLPWWPDNTAGARSVAASDEDAAEAFMRRLVGDTAWQSLPERTRSQRKREGRTLRSELSWLRENEPWTVGQISFPFLCGHGSRGSAHHAQGMTWLGASTGTGVIVIDGAGHGAPNSHPSEFSRLLIEPFLSR